MKLHVLVPTLTAGLLCAAAPQAHPVTVDANPADWTMAVPLNLNTGHLGRNLALEGEYVWADNAGDERTNFATPDTRVDLTELRVTSTATHLYFLVRMTDIDLETGNGAPQVQIAIDQDLTPGSGQVYFGMLSDTMTAPEAAFEYLVVTRFGTSNPPVVYDPSYADVSGGQASAAISAANDVIEIAVPWSVIGNVPAAPLHFTVISCRASNNADESWDIGNAGISDALDVLTNYGDPGDLANSWDEVSDQTVDYHFQLWFHLDPDIEPSPPVVINEVLYNPPTGCGDPGGEFQEIYNRTGLANFPVQGFVLTDEETVDGSEGAFAFPNGATIGQDDVLLVATNATEYALQTCYPGHPAPDYDRNLSSSTPDLVQDPLWASTGMTLANTGDQLLLLDPLYTVIDVVAWGSGSYPGVTPIADVGDGHSFERPQPHEDSDDCDADMVNHANADITPGVVLAAKALGVPCNTVIECLSLLCVDSVCCDATCGSGDTTDCVACSIAGGATTDGTCGSITNGTACGDGDCEECSAGSCIHTPANSQGPSCTDTTDTDCDNPDTCDGAGSCVTNLESNGTGCGDNVCDECDTGTCVTTQSGVAGPGCDDVTDDDCTNPETCDGAGSCQENHETDGIVCGDGVCNECATGICIDTPTTTQGPGCTDSGDDECDNPDACDGAGQCLLNYEVDGTACTDGECLGGLCEGIGGEGGTGGAGGSTSSSSTSSGTGGSGLTSGGGGAPPIDLGPEGNPVDPNEGCACRWTATSSTSGRWAWLAMLGSIVVLRRRTRRHA